MHKIYTVYTLQIIQYVGKDIFSYCIEQEQVKFHIHSLIQSSVRLLRKKKTKNSCHSNKINLYCMTCGNFV